MESILRIRLRARSVLMAVVAMAVAAAVAFLPGPGTSAVWADLPDMNRMGCDTSEAQFLGFSDALNKTTFGGFDVAEISGIAYDRGRGVYYGVADRAGSTASHLFTIEVPVSGDMIGVPAVRAVTPLKNAAGTAFTGVTFDGEAIAIARGGELVVASEGGSAPGEQPEVRRFGLDGTYLGELPVPARFMIGTNNLSFESMAASPNGHSLFTANERPLPATGPSPADGQTGDLRNRIRILRYEDRGPEGFVPVEQVYYLTGADRAPGDVGVTEIIALSETELLVLERGFVANLGNTVRVYRVSLAGAADVSGQPTLARSDLSPVEKTLLFDLADCPGTGATIPAGAVQPNPLLDNFEAMALGPRLPGGRRALILVSDDNGSAVQTTRVAVLAVRTPELAGQNEGD